MMMLTINEVAKLTNMSQYEIRRRVHAGTCPHVRVGAKGTKILIFYDKFVEQLKQETVENMLFKNSTVQLNADNTGYSQIRRID